MRRKEDRVKTRGVTAAKKGDVDTVDHIIAALYDVISGPAGPRDWDRFRTLFYPDARLFPSRRAADGPITAQSFTPDEFANSRKDFFSEEGFFESPLASQIQKWDCMAHVWSTYESRHAKEEKPFARGINSIQLLNDGSRWWVLAVYWKGEEPNCPLPQEYLVE